MQERAYLIVVDTYGTFSSCGRHVEAARPEQALGAQVLCVAKHFRARGVAKGVARPWNSTLTDRSGRVAFKCRFAGAGGCRPQSPSTASADAMPDQALAEGAGTLELRAGGAMGVHQSVGAPNREIHLLLHAGQCKLWRASASMCDVPARVVYSRRARLHAKKEQSMCAGRHGEYLRKSVHAGSSHSAVSVAGLLAAVC